MGELFICNTSSNYISKINTKLLKEELRIKLVCDNNEKIGPHGISRYNDNLLVANTYNNSLSIINIKKNTEIERYFIGMNCSDVVAAGNFAYILCSELNNVTVFDLIERKVVEVIPCGNMPYSIDINKQHKLLIISNFCNDSLTLINYDKNELIENIRVGEYPSKAMFTVDGRYVLVCESFIGSDFRGSIGIISMKTRKIINRVAVGNAPVDMFVNENECCVSNFGEGSVSIIDINNFKEIKRINTGGMPRGLVKEENNIFVGDNYNNLLIKINVNSGIINNIPIGKEPTGMILI